jgi:hypothetical protein
MVLVKLDGNVETRTCIEEMTGDRSSSVDDSLNICQESSDTEVWEIQWIETTAGGRDFQPCPGANGELSLALVRSLAKHF